jgi:hypothetical protein
MYIKDISCISAQNTFGDSSFNDNVIIYPKTRYHAIEPNYLLFIPKGKLRRMGKISKLGIASGMPLINKNPELDGIIIGTANGGLEDCVKFLDQIISYEEGSLTPTNFVQSTSNIVSGTLALMSQNTNYNSTYVSVGLAFESALLDALMQIEEGSSKSLLVGAVEEISDYNHNIDNYRNFFKKQPVPSNELIHSNTKGSVSGEGASMFIVNDESAGSLASIIDVGTIITPSFDDVQNSLNQLLLKHNLNHSGIGTLILGFNGDVIGDRFYHQLIENLFQEQRILAFKNLVGEYPSVSGFALWLACLPSSSLPDEAIYRHGESAGKFTLIYNHFQGENHGFILLSK